MSTRIVVDIAAKQRLHLPEGVTAVVEGRQHLSFRRGARGMLVWTCEICKRTIGQLHGSAKANARVEAFIAEHGHPEARA